MANDINTILHVTGNVEKFRERCMEGEYFDLNKVTEMPVDLRITSGSYSYDPKNRRRDYSEGSVGNCTQKVQDNIISILEQAYTNSTSQEEIVEKVLERTIGNPNWDRTGVDSQITEDKLKTIITCQAQGYYNYEKYNFVDWYSWAYKNWGTKWNVYDDECMVSEGSSDELWIDMMTANGSPFPIFRKLAEDFNFTVAFADRDDRGSFVGIGETCNGEFNLTFFSEDNGMSENDMIYLSDKITGNTHEDDERLSYDLSKERMEELDKVIEKYV